MFTANAFNTSLKGSKSYIAAGNLFWLDFSWSPMSIFINRQSVETLQRDSFREPAPWPAELTVVVAVDPSIHDGEELRKGFGKLKRVSPEEVDYAVIKAIADAIRNFEDNEVLESLALVENESSHHHLSFSQSSWHF